MKSLPVRFVLALSAFAACQQAPGSTPTGDPAGGLGTVSIALRSEVNGVAYRLRDAAFAITGPQTATLRSEDDPDAVVLSQPLTAGMYTIAVGAGFRVEKAFPSGFQTVDAELVSPNPRPFVIRAGGATQVVFSFRTAGGIIGIGAGRLDVVISVLDTSNLPGVNAISAGDQHTCVRIGAGTVRCWGLGSSGQLGYGNGVAIGDNETPASAGNVNVGGDVAQLAAGGFHTCALLVDGRVRCWGNGLSGRLGYGNEMSIGDNETPAAAGDVNVGGAVTQIAAGNSHTCALFATGRVRCWGSGGDGRLGYANTTSVGDNETPAVAGDVDVGGTVVQIATGLSHTCALLADGHVRCWGNGLAGQLGYGNTTSVGDNEAPAVAGDVNVGGLAVKIVTGGSHTCALLDTGNVRCWGAAGSGRLGYGNVNNIGDNEPPASAGDIDVGGRVVDLSAGAVDTCALLDTGRVRCWGAGTMGRLGYGNINSIGDNETPASAGDIDLGVGAAIKLTTGSNHTCVLLETGAVRCWGMGMGGELGYGNTNTIGDNETPASAGNVPVI
ncbi:MAG: hypothetical protein ABUS79_00205 [Pseudomonadota bacterium]